MSRPWTIDTSDWGPFDPASATDAMCERERHAFTVYIASRLKKKKKTGSDDTAILVGAMMAITSLVYSMGRGAMPGEDVRTGVHDMLDYCWLQCASMAAEFGEETVQ